jgi:hypothetical protein
MMSGGLGLTDYGVRADVIGGIAKEFFQRIATHYKVPFQYPPPLQVTYAIVDSQIVGLILCFLG